MLVRRFVVAERSMAPGLEPGDRVIAAGGAVRVGDIVVATSPEGRLVVKRAIALGPARVQLVDGEVVVDDEPSPYSPPEGVPGAGQWTLTSEQVFLLSDAPRRTDADSRSWGPIAGSSLLGPVLWRYRPLLRWGRPA